MVEVRLLSLEYLLEGLAVHAPRNPVPGAVGMNHRFAHKSCPNPASSSQAPLFLDPPVKSVLFKRVPRSRRLHHPSLPSEGRQSLVADSPSRSVCTAFDLVPLRLL